MSNFRKIFIFTTMAILLIGGPINYLKACSLLPPDPWFKYILKFQTNLPQGVTIEKTSGYETYELKNYSSIPFYLVKKITNQTLIGFYTRNSELSPDLEPVAKLVSGLRYKYDFAKGWVEDSLPMTDGSILTFSSITLSGSNKMIGDTEINNKFGDNRPASVQLPPSELFTINAYYQGKPFSITGTVSYQLNERYYPYSVEKASHGCDNWNSTNSNPINKFIGNIVQNPLVMGVAIAILIGLGFLIWKFILRKKKI